VAKTERKKRMRAFKPKLKPVPQSRSARRRTSIPNSLFARTLDLSEGEAHTMLRTMYAIRHLETALFALQCEGRLSKDVRLGSGLEAIAVGACSVLKKQDRVVRGARGHAHLLARGLSAVSLLAEICGGSDGICGGRAGSSHACDLSAGVFSTGGTHGPAAALAVGLALAEKMRGTQNAVLCFADADDCERGAFHEALALAAEWMLPLVFLVEATQDSARIKKGFHAIAVHERARSYGLESATCDGMRAMDVREAVSAALLRARSGGGATLVEAAAHVFPPHAQSAVHSGHAGQATGTNGSGASALEHWKTVDPLSQFRVVLAESETISPGAADVLERNVIEDIKAAVKSALE
jgi:TPP-dependent pyruvate/acetoin dehydrogenase alpha subunit